MLVLQGNELPFAPFSIIVMAIDGTALNGVHYLFETQELVCIRITFNS